jgi:hypothetical protein
MRLGHEFRHHPYGRGFAALTANLTAKPVDGRGRVWTPRLSSQVEVDVWTALDGFSGTVNP